MSGPLSQPLAITAMGGVSPVGATAVQTCTSLRAGLAGFSELPFFETLSEDPGWEPGEPLRAAMFPRLDPFMDGDQRLLELCVPALVELGRAARLERSVLESTALLLSLPVPDAVVAGWDLEGRFLDALKQATGLSGFRAVEVSRAGHTGVFALLEKAEALLAGGGCRYCFLVGVDTYLSTDRMALWDESWRLRSPRNVDGFIPGEASSALLLELASHADGRGVPPLACVGALGFAEEENPITGEKASSGAGLCSAIRKVVAPGERARWIACDLNGESYRAGEWGLAVVRLADALEGLEVLDHPADCIGDIGAATGCVLMSYVAHRFGRPRPPARSAVLFTSADDGRRAAIRLDAPEPAG